MSLRFSFLHKIMSIALSVVIGFAVLSAVHTPEAAAATKADKIVSLGKKFLGVKYKFGAKSGITTAFDCSSFTQYIFGKYGIKLPRISSDQAKKGKFVSKANLRKGDLVFFKTARTGSRIGHVGVYIGNNTIIHTYGKGGVTYDKINTGYWKKQYVTARRVL